MQKYRPQLTPHERSDSQAQSASQHPVDRQHSRLAACRRGLSRIEIVVVALVTAVLAAVVIPAILMVRGSARRHCCESNLRQLGMAIHAYHDANEKLPVAAVWDTDRIRSMALHLSKRKDQFIQANWTQALLLFTDHGALAEQFDSDAPVATAANRLARNTRVALMNCPSDSYNRPDNPFVMTTVEGQTIEFSRGNYALNGGTHNHQHGPGSTKSPTGDAAHLVMDRENRTFQWWGNGIAGFNKSFTLDDFANGQSTLVALEEVRAGVHAIDSRGVWALGQIASNVTWAHGVNGDAYGPNNPWERSDDIQNCGELHDLVGSEWLAKEGMPCVSYVDQNQNATSRSQHSGGTNLLFVDGRVRFVSDAVDPSVWHVIHSRETPEQILAKNFERKLSTPNPLSEAVLTTAPITEQSHLMKKGNFKNSIGMEFISIPAGEFTMGMPDINNDHDLPTEAPSHQVRISSPFWLGSHEVTQDQFENVTKKRPAIFDDKVKPLQKDLPTLPVNNITWYEALAFCKELSEKPEEVTAGRTYRLPTEAEWEYACRDGESRAFNFRRVVNRNSDQSGVAAGVLPALPLVPVGSYVPSKLGLFDMRGNVWEWCSDWFDRDYYSRSPEIDPKGPSTGYMKVIRGCDWIFVGEGCKINYPIMAPWKRNPFVGFRIVCQFAALPAKDESLAVGN